MTTRRDRGGFLLPLKVVPYPARVTFQAGAES